MKIGHCGGLDAPLNSPSMSKEKRSIPQKDSFQEREMGEEAKFKLDAELQFKIAARRNKMLGHWAAERLGLAADDVDSYAKEVIISDLKEPGTGDVLEKLIRDFSARNVTVAESEIQDAIKKFHARAYEEVAREFPEALGHDHKGVGG